MLTANVCPAGQTTPAPCSETFTLSFNIPAGTTIASVNILTSGVPNLDFQAQAGDTSTTLCIPQTYPDCDHLHGGRDLCAALPRSAQRRGADPQRQRERRRGNQRLRNRARSSDRIHPANQSSLTGGPGFSFGEPASVAIDGAGNLFVADFGNDAVYEMLAASGYTTINTLGGGFAFGGPAGVALDGAGNLFVADFYKAAVYELPAAGGYTTVNPLASLHPLASPPMSPWTAMETSSSAISSGAVYEVLAAGGYTTVNRLASSFTFGLPSGLAVDGAATSS